MKPGYNPTRRNRNIGTLKRGHGSDNKMRIPDICRSQRIFWELIGPHLIHERNVAGRTFRFIVEKPNASTFHACSVDDLCSLLELLPTEDLEGLQAFLLRQPTRKQRTLQPVWGRLAMEAKIGTSIETDVYIGPAIVLEAIDPSHRLRWSRSLGPAEAAELDRLRSDGHIVTEDRRGYFVMTTPESARQTQLYRTVPHEIGHWVDWLQRVERPWQKAQLGADDTLPDFGALADAYWARPSIERESFAHRYAEAFRKRIQEQGTIAR